MFKILIADDDELLRELMDVYLRGAGYEVISASDGGDAWNKLKAGLADAAVLDINMPKMTGFEVLRKLRADKKLSSMPVILLTSRAKNEDQAAGYGSGADDYVTKPFDKNILVSRLGALIRRTIGKKK